jgi:hypothetical protein
MKVEGIENIKANLAKWNDKVIQEMSVSLKSAITDGESSAKTQAPWKDRTGNARNSITGSGVENTGDSLRTALAIGMFYGKYLELCNFGKYRIVWPTLEWLSTRMKVYIK